VDVTKTRNAQYLFSPDSHFIEKGVKTSSVCFVTISNVQREIGNVEYVELYQLEYPGIAEVNSTIKNPFGILEKASSQNLPT